MEPRAEEDALVRGTNDDAAISRCSASILGYFRDDFVKLLNMVAQFLQACRAADRPSQIVILGAGSDTTYFMLKSQGAAPTRFFEVDFPEITAPKCMRIQRQARLKKLLPADTQIAGAGTELVSSGYTILAGDLRDFETTVVPRLVQYGLDLAAPTLVLSECVLIYLAKEHSDRIVAWAAQNLTCALFLTYEQIRPNDAFGRMMVQNLKSRGLVLKGIDAYPDLASQEVRYLSRGWQTAHALSITHIYRALPTAERDRLSKIEFLDELEEFDLLGDHYCITWAYKCGAKDTVLAKHFSELSPSRL
ncbi:carboxy methyl transferase for protein phosphatase 2A, partial [Tieghemiomyces parasiticus]